MVKTKNPAARPDVMLANHKGRRCHYGSAGLENPREVLLRRLSALPIYPPQQGSQHP